MPRNDNPYAALQVGEIRALLAASAFTTLASRSLAVVIGYQIYQLTKNPLALGFLGLVEAIPAVTLALLGGHVADRRDRRSIVLVTRAVSVLCALLFALISLNPATLGLASLYGVVFIAGIARGFAEPASAAFEAQVIPKAIVFNASSWISSVWEAAAVIGPALGGFAYDLLGAANTYLLIAALFALSWVCIWQIAPKPIPPVTADETIWQSITGGVRYVIHNEILVGSMALDLFAVLFGGAIALLPVFASDILHVGASGLGFLIAAPSVGALLIMLWSTRHPPIEHVGRNLLLCVAGFGISMILFALSQNFVLTLVALALSGAFDGVSMVIRSAILRLTSPEHLRGRISAVSWIFIGSSNEIGAFESGVAASLLGTVQSVWMGGVVTLLVVAITALVAPKLRSLNLHSQVVSESPEAAGRVPEVG